MRRTHFTAFAPVCPVCARAGRGQNRLVLARILREAGDDVHDGVLHCSASSCRQEYPVIDGVPVIVPDLRRSMAERGVEFLLRRDVDPVLESLIGDAIGPDSWLDAIRQMLSTYAWDAYADQDPSEAATDHTPAPGAARRCLTELHRLAGPLGGTGRVVDVGCAAGRTSLELAAAHPDALVLGLDTNVGLLRVAHDALSGNVSYPRRRIGLVYDRRRFPVSFNGSDRVDFWACDAACLPFVDGAADVCVALNLLDCVGDPRVVFGELARLTRPGGTFLLATPYDWSARATPLEHWIGGHSQRGAHAGSGPASLATLLGGTDVLGETPSWPWHTRLHDRSAVQYVTHLLALRNGTSLGPVSSGLA